MPFEKHLQAGWTRGLVISLAVAVVLYVGRSVFIPLALSILICFILAPLVDRIERWGFGRIFSVISVTALATIVAAVFFYLITAQVLELSSRLPDYKANLIARAQQLKELAPPSLRKASATLEEIQAQIDETKRQNLAADPNKLSIEATRNAVGDSSDGSPAPSDSKEAVQIDVVPTSPTLIQQIGQWLGPALFPLAIAGMIVVLTIFILLEREDFRGRLVQLFASSNLAIATQAMNEATAGITRWLRMMFIVNAIYGVAIAVGLYFIELPNPALWGIVGFACRFLPYIGPWIAATLPFLLSLAVFPGWLQPLVLLAYLGALELTVNMVLEPWLYGKSIGVTPLGIVLAVLFWAWLWGPAGILLAVPITLWLVVLGRHIPQLNFFAVLLGDLKEMPSYHNLYQRMLAFNGDQANAILEKQLQENSLSKNFEQVFLPLLQRTELDRRAGVITDDQVAFIHDSLDNAIDGAVQTEPKTDAKAQAEKNADDSDDTPREERTVLVVPVSNRSDEIAAEVLTESARHLSHVKFSVVSTALLANEIIDRVSNNHYDAVVVCGLSPLTSTKARLLVKRLRKSVPNLPVLSALWKAAQDQGPPLKSTDPLHQIFERIDDTVSAIDLVPVRPQAPNAETAQNGCEAPKFAERSKLISTR